ncbi:hypothetical protein K502DRAFT_317116 [Neoconidiobolus thromboides FSU 785]|nr:hypothetical protein K502DRAFT_317116 [Neoconidiobolus thromboides FSU 785]
MQVTIIRVLQLLFCLFLIVGINAEIDILKDIQQETKKDGIIYFKDPKSFNKYINAKRDFSMLVALTVLGERFDCTPCRHLDNNLKLIAKDLEKNENKDKLFIASLDYEDATSVFVKYGLTGAPNLFLYTPNEAKTSDPKYQIYNESHSESSIEEMIEFLNKYLTFKVFYSKPIDYQSLALKGGIIASLATLAYLFAANVKQLLTSKRLWSAITLVFILSMSSGQMWNSIRQPAYSRMARNGAIQWYASGFQEQYGLESHVIAFIYGIATFAVIYIGRTTPTISNQWLQSLLTIAFLVILVGSILFLMGIFKLKFSLYPFIPFNF